MTAPTIPASVAAGHASQSAAPSGRARVAVIGTGIMGSVLAHRLLDLGFELDVFNRTTAKTLALEARGAHTHSTPRDAVQDASIVLTAVTDVQALDAVLLGSDGISAAPTAGRLLVDVGTRDPIALGISAAAAVAAGLKFVEAPMTGSVHDAEHGTLRFLVGAADEDFAASEPFLCALGAAAFHLGPVGSGNVAKLALNLLVGTMAKSLAEAVAVLRAARIDVATFLTALDGSGLASPLYRRIGDRYLAGDFATRFSIGNLHKDIRLLHLHSTGEGLDLLICTALLKALDGIEDNARGSDYSRLLALESPRLGAGS